VFLDLLDRVEDELAEPFLADRPVVALYISVLLRLAGLDVEDPDASLCGPGLQRGADIFGAVAHSELG